MIRSGLAVSAFAMLTVAQAAPTPTPEPTPNMVKNSAYENATDNPEKFEIREWLGIGSGCRAKFDLEGDVKMEFLGADPKDPNVYNVRFHLPKYGLEGANPIRKGNPTFARECALRFSVFFPKDKRIAAVGAKTRFTLTKSEAAALEVATQLLVGPDVVSKELTQNPKGKALAHHEIEHAHSAGRGGKVKLNAQVCGAPRIVGFDLHLMTDRPAETTAVSATLSAPKTVDLQLTLEPCTPAAAPTPGK